ncbi:hypothetical protein Ddye_003549 [Dipteronia dyeriana]|uniref:HAT C-terminal dimerisation domain-containing protein n=1 Tax=Dipteronia dyeriana TaxID=168575 RepID=A0AAE0CVG4_9ROSI|nr:hypothetical protein Ddye_003549 [Dipteronia dyeriana]
MEKRKHMYWTPCAAHCIDLILEDIGKLTQHKYALLKARKVSNYIYNRGWVLALMREYTKCELIRQATTRFATSYLTLQCMYQSKQPLEAMFVSEKWTSSKYAKKKEGKEVRNIVLKNKHFWPSVVYAIKTTRPLIKVLRLVYGDQPAMGFLYDAIDEAKEKISQNLKGEPSAYKEIWDIIDKRWEFQLHRHLHAAAYFMNPQFQYSDDFSTHSELRSGLYQVMDKLIVDLEERELANIQLDAFVDKKGVFGYSIAQSTINKRSPIDWWNAFGHETPELKKFAVKVLSLTCVASGCECNWSTFNQVHTKKRNRLTTLKMHKLVYILYNKRLKDRQSRRQKLKENEDPLLVDHLPSDDEWLVEDEDELRNDGDDDLDLDVVDGGDVTSRDGSHGSSSKKRKDHPTKDKGLPLIDEDDEWIDYNTYESSLDISSDE